MVGVNRGGNNSHHDAVFKLRHRAVAVRTHCDAGAIHAGFQGAFNAFDKRVVVAAARGDIDYAAFLRKFDSLFEQLRFAARVSRREVVTG